MSLAPNKGKDLYIEVGRARYSRYPLKTHLITAKDDISAVVEEYAKPHLEPEDILVIGERVVAISQDRSFPIETINPSPLARLLTKFVHKPGYGIGIGSPYTMELALREASPFRFALAVFLSALTKPFGIRGVFYHVVGDNINAIDGPTDYTIPPYNQHAKLGPKNPGKIASQLEKTLGFPVVIIDASDKGVHVIAASRGVNKRVVTAAFRDNPMGQSDEQTPLCILRKS
jgi:hypothetical protein